MLTFKQFLIKENDETHQIENYRRRALDLINAHANRWAESLSDVLEVPVHSVVPNGSVVDPERFNENSDIDILAHVTDVSRPHGACPELSQKAAGTIFHPELGFLDVGIFNHNAD